MPLTTVFGELFEAALGDASPASASATAMRDVLVDYMLGVTLAGPS